jgi:hypothetical protein
VPGVAKGKVKKKRRGRQTCLLLSFITYSYARINRVRFKGFDLRPKPPPRTGDTLLWTDTRYKVQVESGKFKKLFEA